MFRPFDRSSSGTMTQRYSVCKHMYPVHVFKKAPLINMTERRVLSVWCYKVYFDGGTCQSTHTLIQIVV